MARERKTCSRCGQRGKLYAWTLNPCASVTEIKGKLCERCDIELNGCILSWFRVKNRKELMEVYESIDRSNFGSA